MIVEKYSEDENFWSVGSFDQGQGATAAANDPEARRYLAKLQKFHAYVANQVIVDDPRPFIGRVSCKGYGLGISVEDTISAIMDFFLEYRVRNYVPDQIESLVLGAREYAARRTRERRRSKRKQNEEES